MVAPHRERTHVEPHERRYLLEEPLLVREPAQKRQRGLHAALVVSERADALPDRIGRRARGLPAVVAKDGESDEEVFRIVASPPRCERVEAAERVVPDVAFRMPLRRLGASDEPLELGIVLHPSDVAQEIEPLRDFYALEDKLRPLAEEPFARKALGRHRAADVDRLGRGVEVEARDELHSAQDAQRILAEVVGDVAERLPLEVGASVPGIDDLVRKRIAVDGVHGEVAPGGCVADGQRRIVLHLERAVSEPQLRLAARYRHVDVEVRELEDAEARADEVQREAFRENRPQPVGRDAEALDVDVLRLAAHECVANASADEQGPSALRLHHARDFPRRIHLFVLRHLPSRPLDRPGGYYTISSVFANRLRHFIATRTLKKL